MYIHMHVRIPTNSVSVKYVCIYIVYTYDVFTSKNLTISSSHDHFTDISITVTMDNTSDIDGICYVGSIFSSDHYNSSITY